MGVGKSVALLCSRTSTGLYTSQLLRHWCSMFGVSVVEPDSADYLWVSLCDPDDLPLLKRARDTAQGRQVVMGGFESYFGVPYLAWADAVVVGEALEFVEAWGRGGSAEALSLPCVLTEPGQPVSPSYRMDYRAAPLVQVAGGKRRYYWLSGRGCRKHCRFCAVSWVQPYSSAPRGLVASVVRYVERRKGHLTLITNDSSTVIRSGVVNAQSVRVLDYLREPARYKGNMLHFGIEGWDEDARCRLGKPIKDDVIRALFDVTKQHRQRMELFFIAAYPGWSMEDVIRFADDVVPVDAASSPQVYVKITYLDPCPHTPLARSAVGDRYCDTREVFRLLNSRNKRIRVFPTRSAARSAWRTALHRASPDEAIRLGAQPRDRNEAESAARFADRLGGLGLEHLLAEQTETPQNNIRVVTDGQRTQTEADQAQAAGG